MKYLMAAFAGIVLSLSFAACGGDDKETGSTEAEIVDSGVQDTSSPSDVQDTGDTLDSGDIEDTGSELDTGSSDASSDTGE